MINAVIIDDEPINITNLQNLIQLHCVDVRIVATAPDADTGREVILQYGPDLVFLDIQMPRKDGFDLLKELSFFDFEIIFVTAHDQYGIQAIKFAAIDYLLKPVSILELKEAIAKVEAKQKLMRQNQKIENLISMLAQSQNKASHRIALPTGKEIRFADPGEIIRCQSSNNYTTFFLTDGEKILVSKPIFEFEELLKGYGFIRCHQSHLVNIKYVKSWVKEDGGYLMLTDKSEIPVSKQRREAIKETLKYYRSF
jgi:two-component system, LytTR family, response regulator